MAKSVANCWCERCGKNVQITSTKYNRRDGDRWARYIESQFTNCSDCEKIIYREFQEKKAIEDELKTIRIKYADYKKYTNYYECPSVSDSYDANTKTIEIYVNDEMLEEIKAWQEEEEAKKEFQSPMEISYQIYKTYFDTLPMVKGSYSTYTSTVKVLVIPEERKKIEEKIKTLEEERIKREEEKKKALEEELKRKKYIEIDYKDYKYYIKEHFRKYEYNALNRTAVLHLLPEEIEHVNRLLLLYCSYGIEDDIEEIPEELNIEEESKKEIAYGDNLVILDTEDFDL